MNPTVKARISGHVQKLVTSGRAVLATKYESGYGYTYVESQAWNKWLLSCQNLVSQIGEAARTWNGAFVVSGDSSFDTARNLFGRLEALADAIDNDLLTRVDDLMTADAFGSLLEQANELFDKKFTLAAGILGRAVLEEHLRKLCERHQCLPAGRPTINDLNQALYAGKYLDKLAMQTVTAMATAGNHCAHNNKPELAPADVRKFLDGVHDFMVRNPLP